MFANLCRLLREKSGARSAHCDFEPDIDTSLKEPRATVLIPGARVRHLAEIAEQGRAINRRIETEAETASRAPHYCAVLRELGDPLLPEPLALYDSNALQPAPGTDPDRTLHTLRQRYNDAIQSLSSDALRLLRGWPQRLKSITDDVTEYQVRGK